MISLASIINEYQETYLKKYSKTVLPSHRKALQAMGKCRQSSGPQMLVRCTDKNCQKLAYVPHSCGHRNCPHCQHYEGQQWMENQHKKQLPARYYLITLTLPKELRDLVWKNQRKIYSMMFRCARKTLKTFTKNDKKLGGIPGFTVVLHTHSRRLDFHPHLHILMPGGSINPKTQIWKTKDTNFLFNEIALAKVFRAMMLKTLVNEKFQIPSQCPETWVAHCKKVGNGSKAITYLGNYLYKGVILEKNILKNENGMVTFRYRESKSNTEQTRTVPGEQFLFLIMQHVLPKGFRKVRSYGFLHPCSKKLILLLQFLLKLNPWSLKEPKPRPILKCKHCGAEMEIIQTRIPPESKMKAELLDAISTYSSLCKAS